MASIARSDSGATPLPAVRRSCQFLEAGLSFSFNDVRACAVVQNGRGRPILGRVTPDGMIDLDRVMAKRREIMDANQIDGYADCKGCPHLQLRDWNDSADGALTWLGITNFVFCNVLCTYCWLNYADYSPMKDPRNRRPMAYRIETVIDRLIDDGLLARRAIVDWGGGGEPTLNPGFDHAFTRLHEHDATQWLHTNAVRWPTTIDGLTFRPGQLRVLCSLDAGTRECYRRVKQRDRFDQVVENLRRYGDFGADVVVKILVVPENANHDEVVAFVELVAALGARTIISDIDHRFPAPSAEIVAALRLVRELATKKGLACRFAAVGSNSAPKELVRELNS